MLASFAGAQTPAIWRVEGWVRNSVGEHLPGARILNAGDSLLALSDERGFYQLRWPPGAGPLTATYLGYAPQTLTPSPAGAENRAIRLDFQLNSQSTALPEVHIGARRVEVLAAEDYQKDILGFDVVGENLLTLERQRKKYLVRLSDPARQVLAELELNGQPRVLHRSCTGVFHVAGLEFAQELILLDGNRLDTFPRYARSDFDRLVEPCVLAQSDYYFFRDRGPFSQSVRYGFFDPDRQWQPLIDIRSEAGEREAWQAYRGMLSGAALVREPELPPNWLGQPIDKDFETEKDMYRGDYSLEHLIKMANNNGQLAHLGWIEALRLDSIYAPLLAVDTLVAVFDHPHDELLLFHRGALEPGRRIAIRYHKAPGWQKQVLRDVVRGDWYALFSTGKGYVLRQLDPQAFEPLTDFQLPEANLYPEQLKVHDGFAYFLARPNPNEPNAQLYKVNIRQNRAP